MEELPDTRVGSGGVGVEPGGDVPVWEDLGCGRTSGVWGRLCVGKPQSEGDGTDDQTGTGDSK